MAGAASSGEGKEMEMVKPKAGFKSDVWKHFGFSLKRNEKGEKVTDKENTVCRHCQTVVKYKSGNTTNMRSHLLNHHPEKLREDTRSKIQSAQKTIKEAFTASLPHNSARAQEITRCIGEYIAKDLRPFSVVDNEGFKSLKQAECISITTDGYVTITAHAMTSEWEIKTFVLQTRVLFESHTGHNIGEVLKSAVSEWELDMIYNNNHQGITVVTDNARNIGLAVKEAGLFEGKPCQRVAAFFHRSSTATAVLTSKQQMLNLPVHKLIMDVVTRWNSSLDMIEPYLEQQQAIAAALLSSEVRRNVREIDNLDAADIADAEDIVKLLTPLKKPTTVLCDESRPTISLIMPLKHMIQVSMAPCDVDSNTVSQMKAAILNDLADRYQGEQAEFLYESSALDPRFRALPHLNNSERDEIFNRLKLKRKVQHEHVAGHSKTDLPQKAHAVGGVSPPSKKTALEDLLDIKINCRRQIIFFNLVPKLWNNLSNTIREADTHCQLKSRLNLLSVPMAFATVFTVTRVRFYSPLSSHCFPSGIYANISLFHSYSEVTVATRSSPYPDQTVDQHLETTSTALNTDHQRRPCHLDAHRHKTTGT
ncbi:hypothetical protein M9458_050396 [Cirrhinus mrigala]|uniref:BED-type domain-containing protein n=1 Tax=Cirrhinus mrigala TaxID=683832 RepID=A0ABD0MWA8_CIRMR